MVFSRSFNGNRPGAYMPRGDIEWDALLPHLGSLRWFPATTLLRNRLLIADTQVVWLRPKGKRSTGLSLSAVGPADISISSPNSCLSFVAKTTDPTRYAVWPFQLPVPGPPPAPKLSQRHLIRWCIWPKVIG